MEELKSTELLYREILEDARGKAQMLLKEADDTLLAQSRDWEEKARKAADSVRKAYEERIRKTEEEIFARLSLDKQRLRAESAESFLVRAMDDFLASLPREKLLYILERELSERLKVCAGSEAAFDSRRGVHTLQDGVVDSAKPSGHLQAAALYSGMDLLEAGELLERAINASGPALAGLLARMEIKEDANYKKLPSLVINTQTVRLSVSVESAAANLLKEKRAELAAALLGEGILND